MNDKLLELVKHQSKYIWFLELESSRLGGLANQHPFTGAGRMLQECAELRKKIEELRNDIYKPDETF